MAGFGVGSLACYDNLEQVGEGTYGYVYKARDIRTREPVALKRLIIHRETSGFPLNAVREIKFLKSLKHKNIVQLRDIATSKGCEHLELSVKTDTLKSDKQQDSEKTEENKKRKETLEGYAQAKDIMRICGNLYLVFEFVEHDIGGLIDSKYKFPVRAIKTIMKQLFEVLDYLSEKKIVHRDIKSSNILISNRHHIKLADFGLARSFQNTVDGRELKVDMTNNVVTMWYRPPELLLGAVRYGPAIDMWSAGCVMAELELGRPLFPGKTEVEQMDLICRSLGTPDEDSWPGISQLPQYEPLLKSSTSNRYSASLKSTFGNKIPDVSLNLMERVLVFDPSRRSSAKIVLSNKYFLVSPLPPIDPADIEPLNIAAGVNFHEYRTKQQRRQREEEAKKQAEGGGGAAAVEDVTVVPGDVTKPPPPPPSAPPPAASIAAAAAAASAVAPPPPPPPGSYSAYSYSALPPAPVVAPYAYGQYYPGPAAPQLLFPPQGAPLPPPMVPLLTAAVPTAAAAAAAAAPSVAGAAPPAPAPPPPAAGSYYHRPPVTHYPPSSASHTMGEWNPTVPPPTEYYKGSAGAGGGGYSQYGGSRSDGYQRPPPYNEARPYYGSDSSARSGNGSSGGNSSGHEGRRRDDHDRRAGGGSGGWQVGQKRSNY